MATENRAKKTILLIDDDTSLLTTLSDFLTFEGYEIVTAASGEQGLKKLTKIVPDLIVLDMSMPGMGGVGFLKEISSEDGKPQHPVLVLTARASMAEFFSDVEVDGFVAKPCNPNDLLMEISRIIFLRSGGEEAAEAEEEAAAPKWKVLIGEDDASVNKRIAAAFEQAGHVVHSVARGPEVLERAIIEKPDIIVMKLVFAGMNGDAVAALLKEMPNTQYTPIVLYDDSGTDKPGSTYTEARTGVKAFVRGNDPVVLLEASEKVLAGPTSGE